MLNSVLDVDDKIYKLQFKANLRENLKILSHCYIAFAFLMNELFGLKKRQVGFLYLDRNVRYLYAGVLAFLVFCFVAPTSLSAMAGLGWGLMLRKEPRLLRRPEQPLEVLPSFLHDSL